MYVLVVAKGISDLLIYPPIKRLLALTGSHCILPTLNAVSLSQVLAQTLKRVMRINESHNFLLIHK